MNIIMDLFERDKYFKLIFFSLISMISIVILIASTPHRVGDPIFSAKNLKIEGNGKSPSVFSNPIMINKNKYYFIEVVLDKSFEGYFYVDFYGKNYDSPDQEFVVASGAVEGNEIIFSGSSVPQEVLLRIHYLHSGNLLIKSIEVYKANDHRIIKFIATAILILTLLVFLRSTFNSNRKLFYFFILSSLVFITYIPLKIPSTAQEGDNMWYMPQVISLISEQNININEYKNRIEDTKNYAVIDINGHQYNYFPYGTVIINYPLSILTKNFFNCNLSGEQEKIRCGNKVAELNAKIFAALSVGLLFLVVFNLSTSISMSFIFSLIFAYASPHLSNHAGGLWSHNSSVFLLSLSLFFLTNNKSRTYMASIPLGLSYVCRPSMSVSVAFLSFYYFMKNIKNINDIVKYTLLGVVIAFLFVALNTITYNNYFPPYYLASRLGFERFLEALLGHLFSPNRGFFVFFPVAIFSLYGMYHIVFSSSPTKNYGLFYKFIVAMIMVYYVIYSMFPQWWMGHSYGPRIFVEITPYFLIIIIPVFNKILRNKYLLILFSLTIIWSLFVQGVGVFSWSSHEWNAVPLNVDFHLERLWDWSDMQIFRFLNK